MIHIYGARINLFSRLFSQLVQFETEPSKGGNEAQRNLSGLVRRSQLRDTKTGMNVAQ